MLEILLIVKLTKSLSAKAREKGRPTSWAALLPLFWILGEVGGFILGAALEMGTGAYAIALIGAALGAGAAFLVVGGLPQRELEPVDDDAAGIGTFDPSNPYSPPGTFKAERA